MNKVVNGHDISFHVDSELKGNVCIYFPAVKESSNLHFHINAPFASTVARDSVRFCDENRLLIKEIADLAVCSMFYFRDHGLLDMNVYATVPNSSDFDQNTDHQYCVIYQELYKAFKTYDLILTSNGEYKKITEVLQTNRDIFKLISNEEIVSIYGKSWIPSVAVQSREAYFFQNLGITQYNAKTIANDLRRNPSLFDMVFNQKDIEWFRDWFAVLSEMPSYETEHLKKNKNDTV